jgi:tetratricopeptide (TPR) repeat protein
MAAHGVRGRGFNQFELAGYLLYRFWPERDRLPFIDIHQTASREDRGLYALIHVDPEAWRRLHQRWRFDYALLDRMSLRDNHLLDFLDADSTWALVFADDVAALYLCRDGPLAAVAGRYAYRLMPGGTARIAELQRRSGADSTYRARLLQELERAAASSPAHAQTYSLLANVALTAGAYAEGRVYLGRALAVDPRAFRAHERLGLIALAEDRPGEALREFREERRLNRSASGLDFRMGQALHALGDLRRSRQCFERELRRDPGNQEARDSLATLP